MRDSRISLTANSARLKRRGAEVKRRCETTVNISEHTLFIDFNVSNICIHKPEKKFRILKFDYLIIGAGISGLSFADTLLRESEAKIGIVDRYPYPGGTWNSTYAHAKLVHDPTRFGLPSFTIAQYLAASQDTSNHPSFSQADILDYFGVLMRDHLLSTGRVHYFPNSEHLGNGLIRNQTTGRTTRFQVGRKIVDTAKAANWSKTEHVPCLRFDKNIRVIGPHVLATLPPALVKSHSSICILGAGGAATDSALYLLSLGAPPDSIAWVRPRESWFLDPALTGPLMALDLARLGRQASTGQELLAQLEASQHVSRISTEVAPEMYHADVRPVPEIASLRAIKRVIRKGHAHRISEIGLMLDSGIEPMPPRTLYVDCTAGPVLHRKPPRIFADTQIIVQACCLADPGFSARMIAAIEVMEPATETKNALCVPIARPDKPLDLLESLQTSLSNLERWRSHLGLRHWLTQNQLDSTLIPMSVLRTTSYKLAQIVQSSSLSSMNER